MVRSLELKDTRDRFERIEEADNPPIAPNVPNNPPSASNPSTRGGALASNDAASTTMRKGPPTIVAVFGKTGVGKTTFINSVTGLDLKVGHNLGSCKCSRPNIDTLPDLAFEFRHRKPGNIPI
jgi:polynucleotide 5'-kinase involved in rRNA processing